MISMEERSLRLYGRGITEADYRYFRTTEVALLSICAAGTVFQFLQLLPGKQQPLELIAAFIYLLYNIYGIVIVRVSTVGLKFEDRTCLWITIRMALAMAVYGAVIMATVRSFENTRALLLMGIFGVINIIVILPTNIFENVHVLHARKSGVGLEKSKPLALCQRVFLNVFFTLAYVVLFGVILTCVALLAKGSSKSLWKVLTVFYVGVNVVPIVVPRVQHLVLTETRIWPLQCIIVQYAVVIVSVILIGVVLGSVRSSRSVKEIFGILGVANGVVVAAMLAIVAASAIAAPRTNVDDDDNNKIQGGKKKNARDAGDAKDVELADYP